MPNMVHTKHFKNSHSQDQQYLVILKWWWSHLPCGWELIFQYPKMRRILFQPSYDLKLQNISWEICTSKCFPWEHDLFHVVVPDIVDISSEIFPEDWCDFSQEENYIHQVYFSCRHVQGGIHSRSMNTWLFPFHDALSLCSSLSRTHHAASFQL